MKVKKQPPMSDSGWPARCEPLRQFLSEPRTWADMKAWRKSLRVNEYDFRNNLAYLENERRIYAFRQDGVFHWAQIGVARPQLVVTSEPDDEALLQRLLPDEPAAAPAKGRSKGPLVRSG